MSAELKAKEESEIEAGKQPEDTGPLKIEEGKQPKGTGPLKIEIEEGTLETETMGTSVAMQ